MEASHSRALLSSALSGDEAAEFIPFVQELVAIASGALRPLFLSGLDVEWKGDDSPVTRADRLAEKLMRDRIEARFPAHGVVGEEHGVREGRGYRWVLDPIDGTRAFISNCFLFGTLIALERDDGAGYQPVLGCIAHPAAGFTLIGHRESSTLFLPDGSQRPARVRAHRPLARSTVLFTSMPWSAEQGPDERAERVGRAAGMSRTWGDCFGYFAIATGGADAMVDPRLSYWDMAAVIPVIEGAGGMVRGWPAGDPLAAGSLLACSSVELLDEIRALALRDFA
jgi:myo-inositol-1(or 4)-monophosphatase